jgi:hypothetical protein
MSENTLRAILELNALPLTRLGSSNVLYQSSVACIAQPKSYLIFPFCPTGLLSVNPRLRHSAGKVAQITEYSFPVSIFCPLAFVLSEA